MIGSAAGRQRALRAGCDVALGRIGLCYSMPICLGISNGGLVHQIKNIQ